MQDRDLCNLKEKLLMDAYQKVRREDFPTEEAYRHYLSGLEDGVLNFYSAFLIQLIAEEATSLKKSA